MPFFTRPDISDVTFRQGTDSIFTPSGVTKFANTCGVNLYDGVNFIPIYATGATSGNVLTYLDGSIKLAPPNASSVPLFNSCRNTTRIGIPVVGVSGDTVQQFLEGYFFPAIPPTSTLSVATGGASRQYGDCSVGDLCWGVTRNTYPITDVIASTDGSGTYNCSILAGGSMGSIAGVVSYTYPFICATPSSATTSTSVSFSLSGKTCCNESTVSSSQIIWRNKTFYFSSSVYYNNSSINTVLTSLGGTLATTKALTLTNRSFNNEFFYYAYPKTFGLPTVVVNGLQNNAWGNPNTGTLFTITFVNTNGYSNQYYVLRSDNKISGSYNITIT